MSLYRKKLIDVYNSLNDKSLHEQFPEDDEYAKHRKSSSTQMTGDAFRKKNVEKIMVKLGGDEKTELKISNQTDSSGDIDLSNVTLEFKDKKYEGLEFKYEEDIEGGNHENEGKDVLFVAEAEDGTIFEVEVNAEANFDMSGGIQDVEWRSLETFPSKEDQQGINEQGCTEQEIKEGTCGYGEDGKVENKPAGPHLMRERFKKLANIVK